MPRKIRLDKPALGQKINQADLSRIPEDLIVDANESTGNPQAKLSKDLVSRLIEKEMESCATQQGINLEELQAWMNLHGEIPQKTQLHLLRTANHYALDPLQEEVLFTKYDPDWQITISVDGWIKIINRHPHFSGITFQESSEIDQGLPLWMECTISRTDRTLPMTVREYLSEVRQEGELWNKMPRRMLRHRALQQCARIAMAIWAAGSKEEHLNSTIKNSTANIARTKEAFSSDGKEIKQIEKLKGLLLNG